MLDRHKTTAPVNEKADLLRVQMLAISDCAKNLAKIAKAYFDATRAEGFTEQQAIAMCVGLLTQPSKKD